MATRLPRSEILPKIDRRRFLQLTAGAAATLGLSQLPAGIARAARPPRAYPFTLGVASGDPSPTASCSGPGSRRAPGVRRRDGGRAVEVDWEVASTRRCRASWRPGPPSRHGSSAHSVHVEVHGLEPWTRVLVSVPRRRPREPVGRTRTTPAAGSPSRVRSRSPSPRARTGRRASTPRTTRWPRKIST